MFLCNQANELLGLARSMCRSFLLLHNNDRNIPVGQYRIVSSTGESLTLPS